MDKELALHLRFWALVEKTPRCWLWIGKRHPHKDYGYFKVANGRSGGRHVSAHRFSYEQALGLIPKGLHIDHLCRVRHCVNPSHLEAVTVQENNRRSSRHLPK
jgi:hypothetical protein